MVLVHQSWNSVYLGSRYQAESGRYPTEKASTREYARAIFYRQMRSHLDKDQNRRVGSLQLLFICTRNRCRNSLADIMVRIEYHNGKARR